VSEVKFESFLRKKGIVSATGSIRSLGEEALRNVNAKFSELAKEFQDEQGN
jgi:hypothetical protein